MDLVRLKWTRGDWLRTSGVVGVLAVNWPVREGSVQERYTESAVGLSVALAALLLVVITANFTGRKLLARLAFFFQGCVGIGPLLLPELGHLICTARKCGCLLLGSSSVYAARTGNSSHSAQSSVSRCCAQFRSARLDCQPLCCTLRTNTFFSRGFNSCQPRWIGLHLAKARNSKEAIKRLRRGTCPSRAEPCSTSGSVQRPKASGSEGC